MSVRLQNEKLQIERQLTDALAKKKLMDQQYETLRSEVDHISKNNGQEGIFLLFTVIFAENY